ncbi:hypothetical protein L7F22_051674 [Adiantum nelumboides]|nr:hypothetical protein [Adiantum nelumboides]
MKKNTPLDYAEFLLTHSRTRCELHIYANGVKEKLASGYLKPFVTHLREAEAQVAKGSQVIRLERPSNFLKKNKVTWFTKGTLERFVRFVSTPEVLEHVKNIDDELTQLEHVRVALSKASTQSEDSFYSMAAPSPGVHKSKGNVSVKNKRSLMGTEDNGADTSKLELLRAMDVRLAALKQEQSDAFSRAMAAGFDSSNMADLLDFSEHFGAERLGEACIQFIGLFRRRNTVQEFTLGGDCPSADAASSDSDMSLESCTDVEPLADIGRHGLVGIEGDWSKASKNSARDNVGKLERKEERKVLESNSSARTRSRWGPPERLQINHLDSELQDSEVCRRKHQLGNYNQQDDIRDSVSAFEAGGEFQTTTELEEQPKRPSLIDCSVRSSGGNRLQGVQQGDFNVRAGMFFSRLHKMAGQVEARRSSEDLGMHFTSIERSTDLSGSQLSEYGNLCSLNDSIGSFSGNSPLSVVSDAAGMWQSKQEKKSIPGQVSQGGISSLVEETPKLAENSITKSVVDEDGDLNRNASLEKASAMSESSEVKASQDEPTSTSARRLSVKAAISLFEGKNVTVGEPPTRMLTRQDSQKTVLQSGSSATEKFVLRKWSGLVHDGNSSKQDTASEVSEKRQKKGVVAENAGEFFAEQDSLSSPVLLQSARDLSSSCARQSAQEAGTDEASLWQPSPSTQRRSCVENLTEAPWEVLPKQANQEPEKKFASRGSPSNLRTNAVLSLPFKPLSDIVKPSEVTSTSTLVPETDNRDVKRVMLKEMVDVQVDLGVQPPQRFKEPKRSSSRARQSAQEAGPDEASLWQPSPSTQRRSCVENLTEAPWEVLPKQANQEPEKKFASRGSPSNLRTNAVLSLPFKPLSDIVKPSEVTSTSTLVPETDNRDVKRVMRKEMVDVQVDLGVQPPQRFKEPKRPVNLSIHETVPKRPPNYKEDKVNVLSIENPEVDSGNLKAGKNRLAESKSSAKIISEPQKEPFSILHETPVDLYMQALVMIIDNHHQSGPILVDGKPGKEQRGRLYDRYWQLRNARQKGENPAKRAEREAKLKSMQEVLQRRKIEMETGVLRQIKSSRKTVKEQEGIAPPVKISGPPIIPQKEKEMGEAEVEGQQDGLSLASSQARAMSKTKVQPVRKVVPKFQRSASASRSLMMTPTSSPWTMSNSMSGTGASVNNQCKMATSSCNVPMDSLTYRIQPVGTTGDARKSTSDSVELSGKSNGNMNGYSQSLSSVFHESDSAANVFPKTADADLSCQHLDAGKDLSFSSDGGRLHGQAQHRIFLEASKGDAVSNPIACVNEESSSLAGTGLTRHEVFHQAYPNEQCLAGSDGLEDGSMLVSWRREAAEDLDVGESIEASIVKHAVTDMFVMHPEKPRSNAVKSTSSIQKPLKFLKEASVGHIIKDATNNEKVCQKSNLPRGRLQDCTASACSDAATSPENPLKTRSGIVHGTYSPELLMSSYPSSASPARRTSSKAKNPLEHERHSNVPQLSKEPARGFKKLLQFGRKNRASEAVASDGVSGSTASEGDDETEEVREPVKHSPGEPFQRFKSQEKGRRMVSTNDYFGFQDQGTTESLQSNIPIPPSNFKLRDDQFLGGSSLKASRSFFSLSSFRSKGSEGKSRDEGGNAPTKAEDNKVKKFVGKFKAKEKREFKGFGPYHSLEERKELMANKQCFNCKKTGHRYYGYPLKKAKNEDATKPETETASKKTPSAGLVPYMIGDTKANEALELFRA